MTVWGLSGFTSHLHLRITGLTIRGCSGRIGTGRGSSFPLWTSTCWWSWLRAICSDLRLPGRLFVRRSSNWTLRVIRDQPAAHSPPLHMPRHPCLLGNKPPGGLACTRFVFTNSIDYRLLAALKLNYELIIELVLLYLWFKEACTISWQCILPVSISLLQTERWNPSTCQPLFGVQTMTGIRIFSKSLMRQSWGGLSCTWQEGFSE